MPVLNTGLATPARGFTIPYSCRFEDGSSAILTRTPGSTTNQKTFTLSMWVKRANLTLGSGLEQMLITASWNNQGNANRYTYLAFDDDDTLYVYGGDYSTSSTTRQMWKVTKAVYRDVGAWMHIVWRHDSTDGTAANRDRIYVNGTEAEWDTGFANDENADEDSDSFFNITTSPIKIGCYNRSGRSPGTDEFFFDGYMAEMHFIDGTSVAASSFGESGDYGEWKPIEVEGLTYGTNGFYLSFAGGGILAATGGTITTDGDYKVHSFTADGTFTPTSVPSSENYVEYLVVAGGAGGMNGGGGAGGYRTGVLTVTAQAYSITVGDGGATGANNGEDSVFSSITSVGGGRPSNVGGSGGGGEGGSSGGAGTAGQGYAGGTGGSASTGFGAGGGGAGEVGEDGASGGTGGDGLQSYITGSGVYYSGGGGGGAASGVRASAAGGLGGGGTGKDYTDATSNATPNTGGGGGGNYNGGAYRNGGSGIVIIRYKFQ